MSSITASLDTHDDERTSRGTKDGTAPAGRSGNGQFWRGVLKWDTRLKALIGLGIGGFVVGVVAFLVLWVLPVMIDQVVTPRFTALEQHMVRLQQDMAHIREDVADVKEDVADVKEDVAEVREDVAEVREDLAYVKGQVDFLIRVSTPGGAN